MDSVHYESREGGRKGVFPVAIWLLWVQQVSTMGSRLSSVQPHGISRRGYLHVLRVWYVEDKIQKNLEISKDFAVQRGVCRRGWGGGGARTKTGQGGILRSRPSWSSGSSSDPITRIVQWNSTSTAVHCAGDLEKGSWLTWTPWPQTALGCHRQRTCVF